ncbi:DNA helicase UvrD [Candidatus Pacearchaeota archaeon]|nr:DNA helicase UvrD [Candidatus Pacearchaeota archaeon]
MQIISDLHIHSKYSRATSKDLNIENLEKWARIKGVNLLGTGDFTHPKWFKELKDSLIEKDGILKTKTGFNFIPQTEISLMYTDGKGRRVHLVVLAPNLEVVQQITDYLGKRGRLDYDGRPIFKIPCPEFAEDMMKISKDIEIIPAHAWTPWFGVFGSATGFNSIEEAFKDQAKNIHAFETGMSSDPSMNWRLSKLDKYSIVSFSDCHSFWPWRIGREATIFDLKDVNYKNVLDAIRNNKISFTIETSPNYGKYHFDGHSACNFSCSPEETKKKYKGICPVCKKPLVIGVMTRVEELADKDRPEGYKRKDSRSFKTILPLHEILASSLGVSMNTKKVWEIYNNLISKFKNEYEILLNSDIKEIAKLTDERIANYILRNREGKIQVKPGYDGEYGIPIFEQEKQGKLF